MLRKIGHITLIILLLISTMGITISKHFCSNHLVSQEINASVSNCCGETDSTCKMCHTEHIKLKIEDDFQDISHSFNFKQIAISINFIYTLFSSELLNVNIDKSQLLESPPPLTTLNHLSLLQTYLC